MRILRHLAISTGLIGLVLAGYHYSSGAHIALAMRGLALPDAVGSDFTTGYSLSRLSILERSVHRIDMQYVDPERVDYDAMFKAALSAVEKEVPEVLLREDGTRLHVQVDDFSTVLQVRPLTSSDALAAELKRVAQILEEQLTGSEVKFEDVEYTLVNGMLSTLDPHSVLMPPDNATKFEQDNEGEFGGLGISIRVFEGQLQVDYPMEDTPAWKAGIKAFDKIVKIDGEGTINMNIDDAVEKMRGAPGTSVTLSIQRDGWETPHDFTIVRDLIKSDRVTSQLLDGNVGYVRIPSFHSQVESQLDDELARLGREAGPTGLRGLVLDMRDNPGGYLNQAVAVSDTFLSKGAIVSTVGRDGADREEKDATASGTEPTYPMAVLMSGSSASAAEIVGGALKNDERAIIVGERSFGKGSVQELYPMDNQSRLKLTVARYLTPGDRSIQNVGIPADIELVKSFVQPPREIKEFKTMSGPRIALFSRDHLLREADLAGHLQNAADSEQPPVYSLRYLARDTSDDVRQSDRKDASKDFEVVLARDVLLAAHGSRRADVLRDAAGIVASRTRAEEAHIESAFKEQNIDWSGCTNPANPPVTLSVSFRAADGTPRDALHAGDLVTAKVTATNTGTVPLCRTLVRLSSPHANDVLDGLEFYLGRIDAGGTRTYETKALLPQGYPTEEADVTLTLLDADRTTLSTTPFVVRTEGIELPRYAWSWKVDDSVGGDGDGIPEVGETVQLDVDVMNVGAGTGSVADVSLRKDPSVGRSVELAQGTFEVKDLAPGARGSGVLTFKIRELPTDGHIPFELSVRDDNRYDYGSVMKGEFYGYFVQTEKLSVPVGTLPPSSKKEPPAIQVTRAPPGSTGDTTVTISGVATDDTAVRDVIVYQGDEKIAYAGGGDPSHAVQSVPFTATAKLNPGNNLIVVLVRDADGLTATRAIDVRSTAVVASTAPASSTVPGEAGRQ